MLSELFQSVLDNYLLEKNVYVDKTTKMYDTLVKKLPIQLKLITIKSDDLQFEGSVGKGRRTDYPWIAIMNKNITNTTQTGLYITYLFRKDMAGFYLVLQQGITYFENTYKKNRYKAAVDVVKYFREEIDTSIFSKDEIDLKSNTGDNGYGYEKTTIISKFYKSNDFDDEEIINDLNSMVDIYDWILRHFRSRSYDAVVESVLEYQRYYEEKEKALMVDAGSAANQIKEKLDPDGEMPFGFNRELKEVEPKVDASKKFKRITNPIMKKTDWVKEAKRDAETGLLGEELVIEYEKERLTKLGLIEYIDQIQWISKKSDYFGYDILSFDIINGSVKEIHIEVKTTTSKVDTEFQVSKGEVEASKKHKETYFVYRVYDASNKNPKFYRVQGAIEDHFILDPITYMAKYKGVSA